MISPAAGRDPSALFDTRPLCATLLALLQSDARFAALSPKFALLVDGGERLARLDHPHDVWLAASQGGSGEIRFVFGLAGCPPVAATNSATIDAGALAAVLPSQVPALVRALLHTFLDLAADSDTTRMRHLLAAHCCRRNPATCANLRRFPCWHATQRSPSGSAARPPMPRCASALTRQRYRGNVARRRSTAARPHRRNRAAWPRFAGAATRERRVAHHAVAKRSAARHRHTCRAPPCLPR